MGRISRVSRKRLRVLVPVGIIRYCGFLSISHLTLSYLTLVCKHECLEGLTVGLWAFDASGLTVDGSEGSPHVLKFGID